MPIDFARLFQESWNFIRNRPSFYFTGVLLSVLLQFGILMSLPAINPTEVSLQPSISSLWLIVFPIGNVLLTILLILNIKAIGLGQYQHFFQPIFLALKSFFPVVLLLLINVFPISLGGAALVVLQGQSGLLLFIGLSLFSFGCYFFVKYCLLMYAYLLEESRPTLEKTFDIVAVMRKGKMLILFAFVLLTHLLPLVTERLFMFADLTNNILVQGVTTLFSALLGVFMLIFSVRFYQIFRQLPRQ